MKNSALAIVGLAAAQGLATSTSSSDCDTELSGYQCDTAVSHNWGKNGPYYSVPSEINAAVPSGCTVNFVQLLSRHGARNPSNKAGKKYQKTIAKLQKEATQYPGAYSFLQNYDYSLGDNEYLTVFGQQEMVSSGQKFYQRYSGLAEKNIPFVRASSGEHVVESAMNFTQGFHEAKVSQTHDPGYPYPILVIPQAPGENNTLNHDLCKNFQSGSKYGTTELADAENGFLPAIQTRFNTALGTSLKTSDVKNIMDLCPFSTIANADGVISEFCGLFTESEWTYYNLYETLKEYYEDGAGNPLGPTQGVGWTNELIARLTGKPVVDETTTNHTLDSNSATFPLNLPLYVDVSHNTDLASIFYTMNLYATGEPVGNSTDPNAFNTATAVPFAARMYVEKMQCGGSSSPELVRVLINDRVVPLQNCNADSLGRCELGAFVDSLSFASKGGLWSQCGGDTTLTATGSGGSAATETGESTSAVPAQTAEPTGDSNEFGFA